VKKLIALFCLVFIGFSCTPEDDKPIEFRLELVPVESVRLPEFFIEGETYEIEMEYIRTSSCHFPNAVRYSQVNEQEILYEETPIDPIEMVRNKTVVIVSVENIIFKGSNCDAEIPENKRIVKAVLKLKIDQPTGTIYTFQFLKERDNEGNPIYFIKEVMVITKNDFGFSPK